MSVAKIPGHGPQPSPVFLVGERPGETEFKLQAPFVGPSGDILNRWLRTADLDRSCCYVTNLCKDYKQGNPEPLQWEIARDEPDLLWELNQCQPTVIGAVGAYATRYFLGPDVDMETVHGVPHTWHNSAWLQQSTIVVPILHPASSFHQIENAAKGQADVFALARVLRGLQLPIRDEQPEVTYAEGRFDVPPWNIAIDTEGSFAYPWCLSVSGEPGAAMVQRRGTPELEHLRNQLSRTGIFTNTKILLHNSMHDLSVLRSLDIHPPSGSFIDTMIMAYLLCLEPQGLKPLAYRHAGMTMSSYEELVHDANEAHALGYVLQAAAHGNWPETEPYLTFERVNGKFVPKIKKPWHVQRYLDKILKDVASDKRSKHGEPVDVRDRWEKVDDAIRAPVEAALGPMPIATLDDVPLDRAIQYAARDADATLRIYPVLQSQITALGLQTALDIDMGAVPMFERMQSNGFAVDKVHFRKLGEYCEDRMLHYKAEITKLTGAEINPKSSDQCADLLFGQLGLKPTKMTKGGQPSTNDKVLESLRWDHPVVPFICDYREHEHIKSSFCDPLERLTAADGRIHTTIRITRVSSGRPASADPNLLNIPTRTEIGRRVREGFIAPVGCVLGTWDLNQIEMRLMAHESQDKRLLEMFTSGKDVHKETAALIFGKSVQDVKPHERQSGKTVGFGVINGMTEKGLVDQMALYHATKNGLPLGIPPSIRIFDKHKGDVPNTRYVGRPTIFGNPFEIGKDGNREDVCDKHIIWLDTGVSFGNCAATEARRQQVLAEIPSLRGQDLLCWCNVEKERCHACELSRRANATGEPWTEDDCRFLLREWFKIYPGVKQMMLAAAAETRQNGFVRDMWGRIRYLPGIHSDKSWVREEAERQASNHKIQAGAAGIIKRAMAVIWDVNLDMLRSGYHVEPLLQVYDEILYELADDEALKSHWSAVMIDALCTTTTLRVPVLAKGGFGPSWGALEK